MPVRVRFLGRRQILKIYDESHGRESPDLKAYLRERPQFIPRLPHWWGNAYAIARGGKTETCRFVGWRARQRKARGERREGGQRGGRGLRMERQTAAAEAEVAGARMGASWDRKGWGKRPRGLRTANYVNCRCCKLPSQFAFILHTIHTVSAHLARNPSTWILLLPPRREEERQTKRKRRKRRRRRRERRWRRIERDGWSPRGRSERRSLSFVLPPFSYLSFIITGTRRCADTSIR